MGVSTGPNFRPGSQIFWSGPARICTMVHMGGGAKSHENVVKYRYKFVIKVVYNRRLVKS